MFFPKWHINDLTFISMLCYNVAGGFFLRNAFKHSQQSFFARGSSSLSWYRNLYLQLLLLVIIFFVVRKTFPHDLGDHFIVYFPHYLHYQL
jgi:hypothetical protein